MLKEQSREHTNILGGVDVGVLGRSLEAEKRLQEECTEGGIEVHDHGESGIEGFDGVHSALQSNRRSILRRDLVAVIEKTHFALLSPMDFMNIIT